MRGVLADPDDVEGRSWIALNLLDVGDVAAGQAWLDSALALRPDNAIVRAVEILFARHRGDEARATEIGVALVNEEPDESWWPPTLYLAGREDIAAGNADAAWDRYRRNYPSLFADDGRGVAPFDVYAGLDLVVLLRATDAAPEAERLLERVTATLEEMPLMGENGSWEALPAAYALAGRKIDALEALERAVDAGWRSGWWYSLDRHVWFDALRDESRFQALRDRVAADMAQQLENLRRMEANGELPTVPGMEKLNTTEKSAPPI